MKKFTSKDIEALREYLDKVEALNQEAPAEQVTPEEWIGFTPFQSVTVAAEAWKAGAFFQCLILMYFV